MGEKEVGGERKRSGKILALKPDLQLGDNKGFVFPYRWAEKNCNLSHEKLTLPLSTRLVIMTTTRTFCSQTMRQKESKVAGSGPWVPMYALAFWKPSM